MIKIKIIKKENKEVGISLIIQIPKIRAQKEQVFQRLRLFRIALQVLQANPQTISLEKNKGKSHLSFSWKDKPRRIPLWRDLRGKPKKNLVKVAAGISAVALIVCATVALMPFINADVDGLCVNDVDVVLIMDTTGSMNQGYILSKCKWGIEEGGVCVDQNAVGLTEEQCLGQPDNLDHKICRGTAPQYTPSAKESIKLFVNNLGTNDKSALVSFNDTASLISSLLDTHQSTKTAIDGLTPEAGTGTNIADAIDAANAELTANSNPQAIKAMILLTDGKDDTNTVAVETARDQAAALGYKIFTIGLGNKVDGTMLYNIAEITGAKKQDGSVGYHYAANGSELADIYSLIAEEICEYGSISGCKYLDANNNSIIDAGEEKLSGWKIVLSGTTTEEQPQPVNLNQLTDDEQGCYKFAGLMPGTYNVSETLQEGQEGQEGWQQTYPFDPVTFEPNTYTETITPNWENITDRDFGNYFPCDDSNLCTDDTFNLDTYTCEFVYNINPCDDNDLCTENDVCSGGKCAGMPINCDDEDFCTTDACVNGECVYTPIDCDDEDSCTTDACDDGVCVHTPINCDDDIECTIDSCIDGECQNDDSNCPIEPVCGDGNIEGDEQCDDGNTIDGDGCSAVCTIEDTPDTSDTPDDPEPEPEPAPAPPSGGGGTVVIPHSILDVRPIDIVADSVTIIWRTSFFATSQVIYSIENETHNFNPNDPPNYGYTHITPEYDTSPKVTFHTVVIPELSPEQTYYYRTISRSSPPVFSQEYTFTTLVGLTDDDDQLSVIDNNDQLSIINDESNEQVSLEEIQEKLNEINYQVETIKQEVERIAPKEELLEKEEPAPASVSKTIVDKEEEIKEETNGLEKQGLLAAIGSLPFNLKIILIIAGIIISGLIILRLIRKPISN